MHWWVGASAGCAVMPCAFLIFVADDVGTDRRCDSVQLGYGRAGRELPPSISVSAQVQVRAFFEKGSQRPSRAGVCWDVGSRAVGILSKQVKCVRLVVGREQWGVLSREKMRPARARSTRQRQKRTRTDRLEMRYLVQGGQEQEQEQELSLGCGCLVVSGQVGRVPRRRRDGRAEVADRWSGQDSGGRHRGAQGTTLSPPRPSGPTPSWSLVAKDTNWPQFPMDAIRVSGRHRSWTPGRSQRSEAQ